MEKYLAERVEVKVTPPSFISTVATANGLGNLIGWGLRMIFVVAAVLVFYHMIMGALDWVQSSGEKEKVEKARKQITSSIIGLIILFAVIALIVVLEQIFGIGMGLSMPITFTKIGTT